MLLAAYSLEVVDALAVQRLDHFAKCLGLAFQVQDDILDVESDTQTLGKTRGADAAAGKPTYPSIIGMAAAKAKLHDLHTEALHAFYREATSMIKTTDPYHNANNQNPTLRGIVRCLRK